MLELLVKLNHFKVIVLNLYRPLAGSIMEAITGIGSYCEAITEEYKYCELYLLGDL